MEEIKNIPLAQKVDELYAKEHPKEKKKEFRLGRKGRLSKSKVKRGFIIVQKIDENKNISFEKQKIIDSTFRTKDDNYHAISDEDILFLKGKPIVIQSSIKLNPYQPTGDNEVYGQKYIKARMLADVIKAKGKGASWIVWILIIGAILFGINYISKNGFNFHF